MQIERMRRGRLVTTSAAARGARHIALERRLRLLCIAIIGARLIRLPNDTVFNQHARRRALSAPRSDKPNAAAI